MNSFSSLAAMPVEAVCPACHGPLGDHQGAIRCRQCGAAYGFEMGFPNLGVGERFADEIPDQELFYEEGSGSATTKRYWLPLLKELIPPGGTVLSVGCGVGTDVEELCDAGFNAVGVDFGNRVRFWSRRRYPDRLIIANGMNLPFNDRVFDCVFCGCVFAHVGVEGDSFRVTSSYLDQRLKLAAEMIRVLKPGGRVFAASPNRKCIVDLFHGRKEGSYTPRLNLPNDPFLLSLADFRFLFENSGSGPVVALPVTDFWTLNRSRRSWTGRLLGMQVNFLFWLTSQQVCPALRASAIAPWLVVTAERKFEP
jgi:SAM-dependent methyltransferase